MATYLDKISAQVADEDNDFLGGIRNEYLEHAAEILHKQQSFVDMICAYRMTQTLPAQDLEHVIVELFRNTNSFVDIKTAGYVVASSLDDLCLHGKVLAEVMSRLQQPNYHLPKKSVFRL